MEGLCRSQCHQAAIFAAQLAQLGMTGPEAPFEGRRGLWEQVVGKPVQLGQFGGHGASLRILSTIFKAFPSQIHTQGPISLALQLRPQVSLSEIAAIRLRSYGTAVRSAATEPEKWAPQTRETADHSIPYLVATALHDGAITPASFSTSHLHNPSVQALIARMTIDEDADFTRRFPTNIPAGWRSPPPPGNATWPLPRIRQATGASRCLTTRWRISFAVSPPRSCRRHSVRAP